MTQKNLALLFGGQSSEHNVSLTSAVSVYQAIPKQEFNIIPIWINPQGKWFLLEDMSLLLENQGKILSWEVLAQRSWPAVGLDYAHTSELLIFAGDRVKRQTVDLCFPILHGEGGEDGMIQGILQLSHLPFVGSSLQGSITGFCKAITKAMLVHHKLPVAPYLTVSHDEWQSYSQQIYQQVADQLGYPCFVKPSAAGSSIGVSRVTSDKELLAALETAWKYDQQVLIEKAIIGQELECAILGNHPPQASVVGEVVGVDGFYDYHKKYLASENYVQIPAHIAPEKMQEIQELAIRTFTVLGAADLARVDFLLEAQTQQVYINEINTLPGFTSRSMYPQLWEHQGISYPELVQTLLSLAGKKGAQ